MYLLDGNEMMWEVTMYDIIIYAPNYPTTHLHKLHYYVITILQMQQGEL